VISDLNEVIWFERCSSVLVELSVFLVVEGEDGGDDAAVIDVVFVLLGFLVILGCKFSYLSFLTVNDMPTFGA